MTNEKDVTSDSSTDIVSEDEKTQGQEKVKLEIETQPVTPKPPKGFVSQAALLEEREKRKKLEEELKQLKEISTSSESDYNEYSDEGKALSEKITKLSNELSSLKEERTRDQVFSQYPQLKDKSEEFEEFKAEYPNVELNKVAKLFLLENDLLVKPEPSRKGLEKPTSGSKVPTSEAGYSADDVKRIRENEPKLYEKLIRENKLKIIK